MTILHIENTGVAAAELQIRTPGASATQYLAPGESLTVAEARLIALRSAEGGAVELAIENRSDALRLDLYHTSPAETKRLRGLWPRQGRGLHLGGDEDLVVLPVGTFKS
ncbi:hypothetical protein [Polymorphum gilvum]|uniref:Uncharacterized protein n=1 Tax=Polymorphum gilvum (strain LMG 25793 / CGMCC 1.9160 / SL003B-26A1) TaxID=991905 RepID=F2J360_POLGS|nr:hypothetical protein [Polymorphum gilvum]ADZ69867.1 hypothetical protein SL003B_1439 [Polymorphum gilvum SL003B-26A1]